VRSIPNPVFTNHAPIRITSMHRPNSPSRLTEKKVTQSSTITPSRIVTESSHNKNAYFPAPVSIITTKSEVQHPIEPITYSSHVAESSPSRITQYVQKCLNCQTERIVQSSTRVVNPSHIGIVTRSSNVYSPVRVREMSPYRTEHSTSAMNSRRVRVVHNSSHSNSYRSSQEPVVYYSSANRESS